MIDIAGSEEVKVGSVIFQTGYSYSSGGYNFSIKLTPYPSNGKSCQVIIGDSGPNTYTIKNAPASCGDLQLTTNSQIGVSKGSNQLTIYVICPLFKFTQNQKYNNQGVGVLFQFQTWAGKCMQVINGIHDHFKGPTIKILAERLT